MNSKTKTEIWYALLALVCCCLIVLPLVGLSGCSSGWSGKVTPNAPDIKLVIAQRVITDVVPAVLNNNPAYEVALVALADGVDVVFAKGGTLTADDVNAYIDLIAKRYSMDSASRLLIGNAILDLYDLYTQTTGTKIVSVSDPNFAALLNSFRDDVREGIARYHAFTPAAAAK